MSTTVSKRDGAVAPAGSSSLFTLDLIIALTLCAVHSFYCYTIYHTYTLPSELQSLHWWLPLLSSFIYGSTIYFGTRFMRTRPAINPKNAMLIYNIYQSGINGFMAAWLVYQAYRAGFSIWGNYEDHSKGGFKIAFAMWMHYNNKYLELFDTFFMIIKKKDEQISFLHVYHHILLVWSWYACISFCIGGDAYFGASFNSLVHFFMYAYYALALFQIPCPWKQHLTMFQMIQFVCCGSQSIYVFFKGNVWWAVPALQLFVMVNMLYLFSQFYVKKYKKGSGKDAKKKAVTNGDASSTTESPSSASGTTSPISTICPPTSANFEFSVSPSPTFSTAVVNRTSSKQVHEASASTTTQEAVELEEYSSSTHTNGSSNGNGNGKKSSSSKKKNGSSSGSNKKRSKKVE